MVIFKLDGENSIEMPIERSKSGIPCLWESGGGNTNTGDAMLIGDWNGEPKKPIFVRRRGELACMEHALIPIRKHDTVIIVDRHRDDYTVENYVIREIGKDSATLELVNSFNEDMLYAAISKSCDYHCRVPVYIRSEPVENSSVNEEHYIEDLDYEDLDEEYPDE